MVERSNVDFGKLIFLNNPRFFSKVTSNWEVRDNFLFTGVRSDN
jgi:hypothetical protein